MSGLPVSRSPWILGVLAGLVACGLAIWMARPLVRLGFVAAEFPKPPGPYSVSSADIEVPLPAPGGAGDAKVPVSVWYPVATAVGGAAAKPLPFLLYAPMWGGSRNDNVALMQTFASHGFVVAAFDDIARDPPALDASPADQAARLMPFDISSEASRLVFLEGASKRAALQAAKASALLTAFAKAPSLLPAGAQLDPNRIGMIGASFGGAAAAETAQRDKRIRAAVNLDGWVYGEAAARTMRVPFAEFNSTRGAAVFSVISSRLPQRQFIDDIDAREFAIVKRTLDERAGSIDVTIASAVHSDFNDELYSDSRWKRWRPWRGMMLNPARMRIITDAYVVAFFNAHLNGTTEPLLRQATSPFPEVTIKLGRQGKPE